MPAPPIAQISCMAALKGLGASVGSLFLDQITWIERSSYLQWLISSWLLISIALTTSLHRPGDATSGFVATSMVTPLLSPQGALPALVVGYGACNTSAWDPLSEQAPLM